ncbi:ROK family protein [Algoriphagus halophytocola]|uniref:ROK family protein n=1 Tax=Algoriphagus halophytocola TaxID=2991499 RepID=A0ABY6MJU7_9BACT|nr:MULTISPECIES: ROK family protein [unclassified Algoriphagus]UZD24053.1 ROK family protein [Algoriphagus sp. TR-M5]WBL41425.1 ROK family protein [Algoriphagus sp. TR-M9]
MIKIGVDIGGSHISAAKVHLKSESASFSDFCEAAVDTFGRKEDIIREWSNVIKSSSQGAKNVYIGIAMPGPFDYENGVSLIRDQGKMASLYQLSVRELLANSLDIAEKQICFINDAEAFLAGESYAGAGRNVHHSLGVTLGTGLGSAIKVQDVVKDAKLWAAPFRDGIAEDYLGTGWFVKEALHQFGLEIKGVKGLFSEYVEASVRKAIFEKFGRALGEFLFPYLIRLKSEGVVLGGKVSLASEYFLPATQEYLDTMGYPVSLKISELGENSALLGACLKINENPVT